MYYPTRYVAPMETAIRISTIEMYSLLYGDMDYLADSSAILEGEFEILDSGVDRLQIGPVE